VSRTARPSEASVRLSGSGFELSELVQRLAGFVVWVPSCGEDSPSSGLFRVRVYNEHGVAQRNGTGMFPREVMKRFPLLPLEEGRLNDLPLRENFIERVLPVEKRDRAYGGTAAVPLGSVAQAHCTTAWTEMLDDEPTPGGLVPVPAVRAGKFHTAHKLTREAGTGLLRAMAHSPS
jgi:hypothetical protein